MSTASAIIGILQPGYLPWLGFFEQMFRSDVFVIYDDVQYDKNGWRNRNRIKTAVGAQWLTIPVLYKYEERPMVFQVKIDNRTDWRKKHLLSIRQNYSKAAYFAHYIGLFEEAYDREWEYLIDIDMYFIRKIAQVLGMQKRIVRSSMLQIQGDRLERLIKICQHFSATTFYEGASGRNYIEDDCFAREGINVEYQEYVHPSYSQLYGDFIPYLSVIDLLFNCGEESMAIILNNKYKETEN